MEKIISRFPEAHLVLAGPDFEGTRARITSLIEAEGLASHVLFTGMLRDDLKWSALAAAECFVLPSYSEGLSVSVLEAMGLGLPVILSDHCNLPEVSALGAGWVIPAEVAPLERALEELLQHSPETNAAIGARGSEFVRRNYNWTAVGGQMNQVYRWIEGGPQPETVTLGSSERRR